MIGSRDALTQLAAEAGERSKIKHVVAGTHQAAREPACHCRGRAAVTTLQPAAFFENAGNMICPVPTRKHGAAIPPAKDGMMMPAHARRSGYRLMPVADCPASNQTRRRQAFRGN